jgi:cytochrome c oxidase subunit 2
MEIHRFEKIWLVAALLLIVGFIGTIVYGAVGAGVAMVNDEAGTVDPDNLENTEFADPGVRKVGPNEYDVYIVAKQFYFDPGSQQAIRVPADSTVNFYVTSGDVTHGFGVVGTNVNAMVIPGQVTKMTVEFEEPGKYGIVCNEYCGSGHHAMAGNLRVLPKDEYNATEAS